MAEFLSKTAKLLLRHEQKTGKKIYQLLKEFENMEQRITSLQEDVHKTINKTTVSYKTTNTCLERTN